MNFLNYILLYHHWVSVIATIFSADGNHEITSMEQSLSEVNSCSATQKLSRPLRTSEVHFCVHKSKSLSCPYPEPRESSLHHHTLSKIFINIIHPSPTTSSKWSLLFRFSIKNLRAFLISSIHVTSPAHRIFFLDLMIHSRFDILRGWYIDLVFRTPMFWKILQSPSSDFDTMCSCKWLPMLWRTYRLHLNFFDDV